MDFRILDQQIEQIENQEIIIHLSGLTQDNKSVYCKVLGYQPYCFLELPVHINWTASKVEALAEYIKNKLKECPPDVMKFEVKKLAMYSVTRPILKILFKTEDTIRHLKNTLRYTWKIEGFNKEFEPNDFKLHEQNIPTLIKFGMERKIDMAGWITVKPIEMEPSNYSECDYSIYTLAKNVKKSTISSDILVDPLICSFDIELHSTNRKSSTPAPDLPENVITMISLTFGRLSQNLDDWDTYVITLYKGDRDPDGKYKSTVIDCTGSEKRLLVNFTKLVKRMKPDIITGYNINGFDWGALLKRAQLHQVTHRFLKMGKLKYELDKINDQSWASGARGKQEILYIKLNGIFNFDMYPEIRFNHNLQMYKLGFVAERFLGTGESKDDMPYQQMFALFDMIEILERSLESVDDQLDVVVAKKLIFSKVSKEELLIVPGMTNHVADLYNELKLAHELEHVVGICREYMLKLLKYVIQDAKICPALMKFLNSLTSLWENANISKCPPNFVYEKGQQIKVLAQYLEQAHWRNYVIPFYNKPKVEEEDSEEDDKKNYQGATVLKVKKGLYKDIAILDFKSLYPSIMIANNICHSTFRPIEDTRTKDEECNIAKWSEHIRCEHDPEKRKKKKGEKAYCGDHKYRFIKHDGDENKKGLLPLLLEHLLNYREQVKKEMSVYDKKWKSLKELKVQTGLSDEQEKELVMAQRISNVLDSRQLAIKVSSNSCYGFLGALTGYFPLVAGAASVTYYGREYISRAISITETNFKGAEVIYGDSVVGNTPLLLQRDGIIEIKTIETLGEEWKSYDQFKAEQSNRKEKQQSVTDYKVWTEKGWSQIKRVIRHKCKKDIWRVNSRFGSVDVTEDHSLLNSDGEKIKPGDLVVDETILLSSFPEQGLNFIPCTNIISNKVEAMKSFYNYKRMGYNVGVYVENDVYKIVETTEKNNTVLSLMKLGKTDEFVYDLETDQGHFHAGVGSTIVKNTDSVFVDFHESSLEKAFSLAFQAAKMVTDSLPRPLELQMENFYSPLLLLTKKRYEGFIVKSNGIAIKEVSKGSINKRRDNCDAAREIYQTTLKSVMAHYSQDETVYHINNQILNLYRGLVPLHNFVIYKGLKQTIEEYKNCAGHVLFAKRLEERGNVMKAGTRLEYVFLKKPGKDLKGGEIMEDWYYFLLNRHSLDLHIDYGYYLEHNIMKPVTEVLNIAYPCAEKKFYKPEEAFKLAMDAYLKPAWTKMLKSFSMEFKAKYIAKHSKKKILYEAAKNYYARVILDKMYAKHGLRKRAYHRPKNGQSHIFLNDKILEQILDYHQFWFHVKMQIKERINIPVWIEIKWSRKN
jgi:DNA polymerase elongation subunit (family B)